MSNATFLRTNIAGSPLSQPQIVDGQSVPAPPPIVPQLSTRLNPPSNETTNSGETTTLDVQPDHRYPIAAWIYSIQHEIQNAQYASHPLASPASLLAYAYLLYIAQSYHNDSKLRTAPSPAALAILRDPTMSQFFDHLMDLQIPSFVINDFEAIRPYQDTLAQNLTYFGTLAGSDLAHDFGRQFPVFAFIRLHNLLATLPANTPYGNLVQEFYSSTVTNFQFPGQPAALPVTPCHLFGRYINDATPAPQLSRNWFNDVFDAFITTNSIRVVNATATVTRIPIFTPATIQTAAFNPYSDLIGINDQNFTQLLIFTRNMHDFVTAVCPSRRLLRDVLTVGTAEIATYLAHESIIPTWHTATQPTLPSPLPAALTNGQGITRTAFAQLVNYLTARPEPDAAIQTPQITVFPPRAADAPNATAAIATLIEAHADPRPADLVRVRILATANEARYNLPSPFIFDPTANTVDHHTTVITSGKTIEANDITAIGLSLPRTNYSLGSQNSEHVLGAIPYSLITSQVSQNRIVVRRKNMEVSPKFIVTILRGLQDRILIPTFSTGLVSLVTATAQASAAAIASFLPGATVTPHVRHAQDGLNVYQFPLGTPWAGHNPENYVLWSSYRYYDIPSQTWNMLPTLRHIYGTRARMSTTLHPANRIN